MAENKMQETTENVMDFVEKIEDDKKRQDAYRLIQLFSEERSEERRVVKE